MRRGMNSGILDKRRNTGMKAFMIIMCLTTAVGACNADVDDAQIEGVVLDATTGLPISKASLQIVNAYYQGGDYDSYGGYDSLKMTTDSIGAFQLKFSKSAYLQVTANKLGYQEGFSEEYIASKESKLVLSLRNSKCLRSFSPSKPRPPSARSPCTACRRLPDRPNRTAP